MYGSKRRDYSDVECAELDLALLKLSSLPSEESNRNMTMAVILGNLHQYLVLGGQSQRNDYHLSRFTPLVWRFIGVISKMSQVILFPKDIAEELMYAIHSKDVELLIEAVRKAHVYFQGVV